MDINKKGQSFLVALMFAVVVIVFALAIAPVGKEFIDNAMNESSSTQVGMDCANTSITIYTKAACVTTDVLNPYFIGFLIFLAGVIIAANFIGGKNEQ